MRSPSFDLAALDQLSERGQTRRAFGRDEYPLGRPDLADGREQLLVAHRDGRPARLAQRVEDEEVADGLRHAQARSDCRRVLELRGEALALLKGADDGRAARCLHR